jgi:hypothetical protein
VTYAPCRYSLPSSLLASQTTKRAAARARKRTVNTQPLTFKLLLEKQDFFLRCGTIKPQTAANRASALRSFLRCHSVGEEDVVGSEMRLEWPDCLEKFLLSLQAEGRSSRGISNTKSALMSWRQMVVEDDDCRAAEAGKPSIFQSQLRCLIGERQIKLVARQTNVPYDMLLGWVNGKVPRAPNAIHIARLERFFATEPGGLASIAGVSHAPRLRPVDLGSPPPNEYREGLAAKSKQTYWLKPAEDSPLRKQWYDFLRYKTECALPETVKRSKRGKWRLSPLPMENEGPSNWYMFLDGAEVPSARAAWAKVAGFLGWLTLAAGDKGGMGLPEEEAQTLAWLAVPELMREHSKWKSARSNGRNSGIPELLGWFASLVRAEEGYFPQNPWLLETLPEGFQGIEWQWLCAKQRQTLSKLVESLDGEVEISRDPFAPISSILDLPQPMEAVVDMFHRLRADRPVGDKIREAIWSRDIAMLRLMTCNPLRKRMFAHLSWKADNTGNLYQRLDGSWWIKWQTRYFKNAKGAAGERAYDAPVHPSAWNDIERYLRKHRPTLMRAPTDLVFLSTDQFAGRTEVHKPWKQISERVRTLTRRYLFRCPGIGTQAIRHLVGTSIIRAAPAEMETVAKVLNDRVETVRKHYARLGSGDAAHRMGDLLASSFNRM